MTKLEGIRELAIAVFDNMPVRIARPKEMEGLYEILRDPANSCAIGLCMYGAGYFTPYEIDSEKKMRYKDEIVVKNKILKDIVYDNGVKIEDKKNIEEVDNKIFRGSTLDDNYIDDLRIDDDRTLQDELNEDLNKKEKKPNIFSVIWNKITQLF